MFISPAPAMPRHQALLGALCGAKAALDALARTYAAETKNITRVRVMAVNPGPMRTKMRAQAMPGEDPMSLRTPEELAPKILALCSPGLDGNGHAL